MLLALVVILTASRVGSHLARLVKLPEVLGELIAGIVIGNLVLLGFSGLESIEHDHVIGVLAEIGVLLLMFEVGLETSVTDMLKVGPSAFLVAVIGVICPFGLGWLVSAYFLPHEGQLVHAFVGAVLCATSVGITARVLKDSGNIQSPLGRIILGAAVIDDVLGLLVLAVMTGIIEAHNSGQSLDLLSLAKVIALAVGFLFITVAAGRRVMPFWFRLFQRTGSKSLLPAGIIVCFAVSYLAALAGLAPIVGAFAAGLIIEREFYLASGAETHAILDELLTPLALIFVPVFFIVMGARVDLGVFANTEILAFSLVLTLAAILGKQACGLAVLERAVDRFAVGLGMIPRGEVGLIFAGIGLSLKVDGDRVISSATYAAIVVMVVLTTLITPPLLKWRLERVS